MTTKKKVVGAVAVPIYEAPIAAKRAAPSCSWPIGDPKHLGFKFCGDKRAKGKSYCAEHVKLAYAVRAPKRSPSTLPR